MTFALLSSSVGVATTAAIDTTGAKLIVLTAGMDANATVSDSKGNTWSALTQLSGGSDLNGNANAARFWYCVNPTVGSGHTFTVSQGYAAISAMAFSATGTPSFDAQATGGGSWSATNLQAATSLTPAAANGLVVSGVCLGGLASSPSINGGFTVASSVNGVSGTSYGVGAAYLIQTTAAAAQPTWSWTNAAGSATVLAAFLDGTPPEASTLSTATVDASGAKIALTFTSSIGALAVTDLIVTCGGYPVSVSATSGSGTSWNASLGQRWVRSGTTVTVNYQSAGAVSATNSSVIVDEQVRHVGRKFGMFVHFGINTFNAVEWSDGSLAANTFAPSASIAVGIDSWIAAAKLAGMRYLVLTSKHHDGFALWPSAAGGYNISNSSWWAGAGSPDIVSLFTQKVRAAGLGVGLYFSVWDRHWEAANSGFTGAAYTAHCQAHLTDLLTKFGPIDLLWLDGWNWVDGLAGGQPNYDTISHASLYNHAKGLQPKCLFVVNNHDHSLSTSDIDEYEMGSTGGAGPAPGQLQPAEVCDTIRVDNKWFWSSATDAGLSAATILSALSAQSSNRTSYLLNVPPSTSGAIPDTSLATLAAVGSALLEDTGGVSAYAGNSALRSFSVTLTTNGSTAAANLTGLKWAIYEAPNPAIQQRPIAQGMGSTNGAGVISGSFFSQLAAASVVWITVTDSDGTTTQSPAHKAFSGPVVVS